MSKNGMSGSGRSAAQRAAAGHGASSASADHPHGKEFADRVLDSAGGVGPEGRFGDNKVFLMDAHAAYIRAHGPITMNEFGERLVEANKGRHLDLARADLVEAMKPHQVSASEIHRMTGHKPKPGDYAAPTAHFVRVERKKK